MRKKLFERALSSPAMSSQGPNDPVAVIGLQLYLMGLISPRYRRGLAPDGDYGQKTVDAVNVLRGRLGLEKNGRFGPRLKAALKKGNCKWAIGCIDFDAIEIEVPDEVVGEPVATTTDAEASAPPGSTDSALVGAGAGVAVGE